MKKLFAKVCVLSVFCAFNIANFTNALTIAVDPGHGSNAKGACVDYKRSEISGDNLSLFSRVCEFLKDYFLKNEICEKDINLKIAKYLKVLLENYFEDAEGNPVKVILTRSDDLTNPTLEERVNVAKNSGAVALISLHNNATKNHDKRGAMILVTSQKNYLPDGAKLKNIYEIEDGLAECFLSELNKFGIETYTSYFTDSAKNPSISVENGRLRRFSEDNTLYPNGELADYYGIVRHGILKNVPSLIVEHAHMDNKDEFKEFLSSDKKLFNLACADAKALAKFYDLKFKK